MPDIHEIQELREELTKGLAREADTDCVAETDDEDCLPEGDNMPDYEYEAELGPDSPEGREGMASLAEAILYVGDWPAGVIYVSRTDWVDERPRIRWVSLDQGHFGGKDESEILQTINVKFAEQVEESIQDNDTKPLA